MDWSTTRYAKWYQSHRRFSFTANYCIGLYEETGRIPDSVFRPFLRSVACHSKAEERFFTDPLVLARIQQEHATIQPSKAYSHKEKLEFCQSLLDHMKEEEAILLESI